MAKKSMDDGPSVAMRTGGSVVAFGIGSFYVLQSGVNVGIGRVLGHGLRGALVNFVVASIILIPLSLFWGPSWKAVHENYHKLQPKWWVFMAGFLSSYQVAMNILLTPELGFATFFLTVTLGQIISSLTIDHLALFNFQRRKADVWKLSGIILVMVGVVLSSGSYSGFQPIHIVYLILSLLAGLVIPFQAALLKLATDVFLHPARSVAWNFFLGSIILVVASAFSILQTPLQYNENFLHWYNCLGGVMGCVIVAAFSTIPRRIGFGSFFIPYIAGNLTASILFDTYNVLGVNFIPASTLRIVGVVLGISGAATFTIVDRIQDWQKTLVSDPKRIAYTDEHEEPILKESLTEA